MNKNPSGKFCIKAMNFDDLRIRRDVIVRGEMFTYNERSTHRGPISSLAISPNFFSIGLAWQAILSDDKKFWNEELMVLDPKKNYAVGYHLLRLGLTIEDIGQGMIKITTGHGTHHVIHTLGPFLPRVIVKS